MPRFFNTSPQRAYVQNPGQGLVRVGGFQEVEAEGEFADNCAATPGLVASASEEGKEAKKRVAVRNKKLVGPGPEAFPAVGSSPSNDSATQDLDDLTKDELRARADEQGVEVKASANKAELIEALRDPDASQGTVTTDDLPEK